MTDNKDLALGKLTPDWEMSCSLLPTLFGVSPYLTLNQQLELCHNCLLYTSPSPRDATLSRMPSSA